MAVGIRAPQSDRSPSDSEIRAQLKRITGSSAFDTSQRTTDFLRFVVEETLADRAETISQNTIAHRVFGRGDEFDATNDPIVRMQAGRVRRSLDHYYLTAGSSDPVSIFLPKGTYVPRFEFRTASSSRTITPPVASGPVEPWPTLLVSPLHNLTGREDVEFIAQGLASDLAVELNRYTALSVFLSPHAGAEPTEARLPQFELTGAVTLRGDDYRISFHLIEKESGRQTWAHSYACPTGPARGEVLDKVVQATAATVAEDHGVLASHLRGGTSQRPCFEGGAYEAILRYLHFEVTLEPLAFVEALAALRQAVESNPECALCWSYLARLGGTHWGLGIPGEVIPIEDSISAARRGVELAPLDVRCRVVLAYVLLLGDEVDEARTEANTALQLSDMSNYWLDAVGYLLTLSGDWARGPALIRQAIQINPFPRKACYCALWLDAIRRSDAPEALSAARKASPEAYFWTPLMQAVALVTTNQLDEAHTQVERLLQMQPSFPHHAGWLIARYVKCEDLAHRIEDALEMAGVAINRQCREQTT
jgi:adenylate cyclase